MPIVPFSNCCTVLRCIAVVRSLMACGKKLCKSKRHKRKMVTIAQVHAPIDGCARDLDFVPPASEQKRANVRLEHQMVCGLHKYMLKQCVNVFPIHTASLTFFSQSWLWMTGQYK